MAWVDVTLWVKFGLNAQKELLTVKIRILVHPKVKYGPGQPDANIRFAEWNMQGRKFFNPEPLGKWTCLSITMGGQGSRNSASLNGHLEAFTRELGNCGMECSQPQRTDFVVISDEKDPRLEAKICALAKDFEFLLVILPKKHTPLCNKVKHYGDVRYGSTTRSKRPNSDSSPRKRPWLLVTTSHIQRRDRQECT